MKRVLIALISIFIFTWSYNVSAQISKGGLPPSFELKTMSTDIDRVNIHPPDMEQVMAEDQYYEKNGEMYRISRLLPVNLSPENAGTWDELEDGTRIWRLEIFSEGARALSLHYSDFVLPEGSALFVYNANKKQVAGAFTADNNSGDGIAFSTQIIQGDLTTIEYVTPPQVQENPVLNIERVSYIYRGFESLINAYSQTKETGYGYSGDCEVNVACPEGDAWQDEIRGVASIYVIDGWSGGSCTGSLINNTSSDGTPYFLTADHCGGTASASDMNQWEFYFNYEAPTCSYNTSTQPEPDYNTIVGATKIARGPESGGSDFLLLELNETPPANYSVYYNGWDRSTTGASSGVGIHHPQGDIKKISYCGAMSTTTWAGGMSNAHWDVVWQETATDWGVTEGGSSGSPIFNENNKKIVGTLTGGGASCANQSAPDQYGKFDVHWDDNGSSDAEKLQPWLDPTSSGDMECEGYDPNQTADDLVADFSASPTSVAPGGSVDFTDLSTGDPATYSWEFEGASTATSSDPNPSGIVYPNAGTYDVTLTISDGADSDEEIKTDYITVTDDPPNDLDAEFNASDNNIFVGDCINFQDMSSGDPTSWEWTFEGAETPTSTETNPVGICYNTPGEYDVTLTVENADGTDTETEVDFIVVQEQTELPVAAFYGDQLVIPVGGVVTFTDTSLNGPFQARAWTFEGGTPPTSTDSVTNPIAYLNIGEFDVELRVEDTAGNQSVKNKADYIRVVPDADYPPEAWFVANYTVIQPGEAVNFIDLSDEHPFQWEWTFESAAPNTSAEQHPQGIVYNAEGDYDVQLIIRNSEGYDTVVRENYIHVSSEDDCTDVPIAAFQSTNRLLTMGDKTYFEDQSQNNPTSWNWYFQGGYPEYLEEGSPSEPIEYNIPGRYDVTLTVNNLCGTDVLVKDEYIYVFSDVVYEYCDTMTNIQTGEVPTMLTYQDGTYSWGWIAGHNSERPSYYADYFEEYTFSQIRALIVPISKSINGEYNSYVKFYIWDGSTQYPDSVLAEKKVFIRDLPENYNSVITFDPPVTIDGPFFAGFKLNYPDDNEDGISDDLFVVSVAPNRGPSEANNTLYVQDAGEWYSSVELFNIGTSLAIKPVSCLVDIEEFEMLENVQLYPNPARDWITIELSEEYAQEDISTEVYDMMGRKLGVKMQEDGYNMFRMNFSSYPEGIYFIKLQIGDKTATKKLLLMD